MTVIGVVPAKIWGYVEVSSAFSLRHEFLKILIGFFLNFRFESIQNQNIFS